MKASYSRNKSNQLTKTNSSKNSSKSSTKTFTKKTQPIPNKTLNNLNSKLDSSSNSKNLNSNSKSLQTNHKSSFSQNKTSEHTIENLDISNSVLSYQELFKPDKEVDLGETYRTPVKTLEITEDDQNRRIDNFLISILPNIPKSNFYKLLRKGEIRVNKGRIKPEYKLQSGDLVRICPLELVHKEDKTLNLDSVVKLNSVQNLANCIVYEDKDLIIINKPAGIAVHGGSGLSFGVIEAIRHLFPLEKRLELVHRIDRDTSGLLMIAKKTSILKNLQDQFRFKTIHKSYYCLVPGKWTATTVDAPLNYYLNNGEKFVEVSEQGKPSVTNFKVVQYYRDQRDNIFSLVEASPRTGRTHQIRVHCLHALGALVGDVKYSSLAEQNYYKKQGINRMFLHAFKLNYIDPKTEQRKIVEIPLDSELQKILDNLIPVML